MKPITLSIFFPAYNEEKNIKESVTRTIDVVRNSPFIKDYEIIIVNDGSKDGTEEVARTLTANFPSVRLINHFRNM
jgi:glycosyltransferase involved in cell wall biosynthesis